MGSAIALLLATPAQAQTVTSPGPASIQVSIYRAPDRPASQRPDLSFLQGYALVTETRTIAIPAGDAVIRFEGVAGGLLPESAIVTGLPDGVVEKNQGANLLSPGSLLGAATGRAVTIRRTNAATGAVVEEDAVLRSGPDGAAVLQTAAGYEALRCSGLAETIVYPGVPAGLSAKPTLSVRTSSRAATSATVTLSYLAANFDWSASYVAELNAEGTRMDLSAWVTLASSDATSFVNAETLVIAGRVDRQQIAPQPVFAPPLELRCYPTASTSDGLEVFDVGESGPPAPAAMMEAMSRGEIVVTGRMMKVTQEELGDLKLYRVPERVTVAANAQKQVGLLDKPGVAVRSLYRSDVFDAEAGAPVLVIRARNRTADGLGLALPSGSVAVYARGGERMLLLGEGSVEDKAVGEEVEFVVARASGVIARVEQIGKRRRLVVTNPLPRAVDYEARFDAEPRGARLRRRDGRWSWVATIPANGSAALDYSG